MNLTLAQIAQWSQGTLFAPSEAQTQATGYSIDTRTVVTGDLFFALKGENFDGHDFLAAAYERGAIAAIVSHTPKLPHEAQSLPLIVVDDTLKAMQRLAAKVRAHWQGLSSTNILIGITGSAGKTTTKEAVATALATKFATLRSHGNLNNHIGVPLQLLRLTPQHKFAVIEMGMNHSGEIAFLCELAAPQWGIVSNVGNAHAQNFPDGIEGIAKAKHELIAALPEKGIAFLNCDDPRVAAFTTPAQTIIRYGQCPDSRTDIQVRATQVNDRAGQGLTIYVSTPAGPAKVELQLLGTHNVSNVLAAMAVATRAGVPPVEAAKALAALTPGDRRGECFDFNGARIVNDTYNSNPEALQAMTHALAGIPATRRILVAGEMLELGPTAPELHAQCGRTAAQLGIQVVIGVRGLAQQIVEAAQKGGAKGIYFETPIEAGIWLHRNLHEGDAVVLKASRGVHLEEALNEIPNPANCRIVLL